MFVLDEVVVQQIQTQMAGAAQALQRAERDLVGMGEHCRGWLRCAEQGVHAPGAAGDALWHRDDRCWWTGDPFVSQQQQVVDGLPGGRDRRRSPRAAGPRR